MKRTIKYLVVHCTAGSQQQTVEQVQAWWKTLGWKRPGYHYIIRPDGTFEQLQPEELLSNGVQGYNMECVNICYIGGIDGKGRAVDNRTEAQKATLIRLLKELKQRYPAAIIQGHRDFSPDLNKNGIIEPNEYIKMCPCFDAKIEYKNIGS